MGPISHLPRALINQLRSSSILSDVAQAVEELICNSLDAGAKRVCASVDLGHLFLKVEDDGSGISREDLTLVGERHATSKLHDLVELEGGISTLGFRGEALSSLSEMAILELTSRTRGSPNTYKKIMKGGKMLSLGLCSEQRDPGTTVILRNIFYNLPVRRKLTISSCKRVLQSVREHVLRLALIHPDVSFTVTDLERQEELIQTWSDLSPLNLLCEFFGEELRHGLHQLNYRKQNFRLSGFISKPMYRLKSKAVQFFYINRRFVHKTPVHKFLNTYCCVRSSARNGEIDYSQGFEGDKGRLNDLMLDSSSWKQSFPAFLLDLSCPLSSYDITFEATKAIVEFKDWNHILSFIREALETIWERLISLTEGGNVESDPIIKAKSSSRKRKSWQHVDPSYHPSGRIESPKVRTLDGDSCVPRYEFRNVDFGGDYRVKEDVWDTPRKHRTFRSQGGLNLLQGSQFDEGPITSELDQLHTRVPVSEHNNFCYEMQEFSSQSDDSFPFTVPCMGSNDNHDAVDVDIFELKGPNRAVEEAVESERLPVLSSYRYPRVSVSTPVCSSRVRHDIIEELLSDRQPTFSSESLKVGKRHCSEELNEFEKVMDPSLGHGRSSLLFEDPVDFCSSRSCSVRRCLGANDYMVSHDASPMHSPKRPTFFFDSLLKKDRIDSWMEEGRWPNSSIHSSFDSTGKMKKKNYSQQAPTLFADGVHDIIFEGELGGSQDISKEQLCTIHHIKDWKHHSNPRVWSSSKDSPAVSHPSPLWEQLAVSQFMNWNIGEPEFKISRCLSKDALGRDCEENLQGPDDDEKLFPRRELTPPKVKLQRSLSGPPFYKPSRKYGLNAIVTSSLSVKDQMGKHQSPDAVPIRAVQVGRVQGNSLLDILGPACNNVLTPSNCKEAPPLHQEKPQERSCVDSLNISSPQEALDADTTYHSKWRENHQATTEATPVGDDKLEKTTVTDLYKEWMNPCMKKNERDILDLRSGNLGPSNKQLFPEMISKGSLKNARVLRQLGKKFIAIVAQGTLIVVDQHAADERIRLEQLREEVLSAKGKQARTLLDHPQEMSITMGDQQLLQTYRSQIEDWGWRFKILRGNKESLKRKGQSQQATSIAFLSAVPYIQGESLDDKKFLSEYLQQLADTDGSSAPPPAVLRLLSSKACRGAIMFGDSLLQTECQQIIEGLKKTSLCFQCAHGRPTAVPIVNLHALHKRLGRPSIHTASNSDFFNNPIPKMGSCNISDKSRGAEEGPKVWHGLQWQRATMERGRERLMRAEEM